MRLFKCEIAREDNKAEKEGYTLTGDELVEYLNDEAFTVFTAEKISVDEDKIEEVIRAKLQEAYAEILTHHNLNSGDITPLEIMDMDSKEEQVVNVTQDWIEGRLN